MLSIAQVSGVIAAVVIVVQYVLPTTLVIMLVAHLGVENTAATWSSVNRTISNTLWPLLLGSDSVGNRNRSYAALAVSWAMTLGAILIAVAGVTTPLGLRNEILPGSAEPVVFQYTKDPSSWGRATMVRPDHNFGRVCEVGRRINCPGQYNGVDFVEVEPGVLESVQTDNSSFINSTIPANFTAMFSSATSDPGNTLSGLFDIQYRRWTTTRVSIHDNGKPQVRSDDTYVENVIPMNDVVIREGLIIDVRQDPGIGFRNHTVPVDLPLGGTWTEDLTWLEPVTQCVDTNLTIEIQIEDSDQEFGAVSNVYLVDRGAFRGLDLSALEAPPWNDNQTLDLFGRAHQAARMYNVFVADHLGLSLPLDPGNDTIPSVPAQGSSPNSTADLDSLFFGWTSPELIQFAPINGISGDLSSDAQSIDPPDGFEGSYDNGLRRLFASNHTAIDHICQGYYILDDTGIDRRASNVTNPAVACGLVIGSARSLNADNSIPGVPSEDGSDVLHKTIYMCASGIKASIKTVDFKYNGTNNHLPNLEVTEIRDKVYENERSKPLWAVEASEPLRMNFDPLWGMVDDSYETTEGFSTIRSEKLWLPPAVTISFGQRSAYDSLAAISTPALLLQDIYGGLIDNTQYTSASDYLYPLVERFMELSVNESTASQIPSLVIADSLASMLVGTKTAIRSEPFTYPARLSVNDDPNGRLARASVVSYHHALGYDLRYAIPGFIALFLLALTLLWATLAVLFSRGGILATLTDMYNQTSTGRLAVGLLRPGQSDPNEPSSTWVDGNGSLSLKFGRIRHREMGDFVVVSGESRGNPLGGEPQTYVQETGVTPVSPMTDASYTKVRAFEHTV